jgi:hypothetical protein
VGDCGFKVGVPNGHRHGSNSAELFRLELGDDRFGRTIGFRHERLNNALLP